MHWQAVTVSKLRAGNGVDSAGDTRYSIAFPADRARAASICSGEKVDAGEPGAGAVHRARQHAGAGAGVEHAQTGADGAGFLQLPVERSRVDVAVFRVVRRRAAEIEPVAVVDRIKREFHENHLRFPKYIPDRAGMQSKRGKKGERA